MLAGLCYHLGISLANSVTGPSCILAALDGKLGVAVAKGQRLERELGEETDRFAKEAEDCNALRLAVTMPLNVLEVPPGEETTPLAVQLADTARKVREAMMRALCLGV